MCKMYKIPISKQDAYSKRGHGSLCIITYYRFCNNLMENYSSFFFPPSVNEIRKVTLSKQ